MRVLLSRGPHLQEGIDAIGDVIYHVETFDVTTIRASTPMFLMSRKIKALGRRGHAQGAHSVAQAQPMEGQARAAACCGGS